MYATQKTMQAHITEAFTILYHMLSCTTFLTDLIMCVFVHLQTCIFSVWMHVKWEHLVWKEMFDGEVNWNKLYV